MTAPNPAATHTADPVPQGDFLRGAGFERAALVALDWGTTSLRAYLFDPDGNVLATRASSAGIMNLPLAARAGGFDAAFENACGTWLDSAPDVPVIAAGMVAGIVRVKAARGVVLHIVPGVLERGKLPNVMRGEETQIVGALAGDAALERDHAGALIGLPGTHAKWAVVRGGRIEHFYTFMTGEMFAALRDHTILGRTMAEPDAPNTEAFLRGVTVAKQAGHAGLLATIFSTRTLGLTAQLSSAQQSDYLSGLLIGHELRGLEAVLKAQHATLVDEPLRLIGNDALCDRYRLALAEFGCTQATLVREATERGLWFIATQAGLVGAARAAAAPRTG
jgi:2-dehydro-3-deoxygalactonokinase